MAMKAPLTRKLERSRSRKHLICGFSIGVSTVFISTLLCMFLLCFFFLDMEMIYRNAGMTSSTLAVLLRTREYAVVSSTTEYLSESNFTTVVATPVVEVEVMASKVKGEDAAPALDDVMDPDQEKVTRPVQVVTEPDDEATTSKVKGEDAAPAQDDIEPVQEVVEPVQEVVEPVQEVVEPDQEVVEPDQEVVEPDQEVMKPGKEVMEPVQEAESKAIAPEEILTSSEEGEEGTEEGETDSDAGAWAAAPDAGEEEKIEMKRDLGRGLRGCNITQGQWVYDNISYPLYHTRNCPFADPGFRCEENGRPDKEWMSYHWQPNDCDLPRFNATDILERLRGQRMVFVGDSLGRNNWESMLCMLAEGVADKSKIYEVNGEPITKHSGKLVYRFVDYNCTVEYYRDPFLVPQTRPPRGSPSNVSCVLRVDHVSWSVDKWWNADIIIFNAGHWWTEHKIFRQGCRFQDGDTLRLDYSLQRGLKKALQTWVTWLEKNLDPKKSEVFWLSFPSVHFRGGSWNKGGHCDQEHRPLTEEEVRAEWQAPWMNHIVLDEFMGKLKKKLSAVTYLDITTATNYRSDGHGALYTWDTKKYGLKPRNRQDCSHFCLPGVPDAWNELILASLFAKGKGTWAQPVRL